MKTNYFLAFICSLILVCAFGLSAQEESADCQSSQCVDPLIGTGGYGFGAGSSYPGASVPFGLISLSPDTTMYGLNPGFSHCSGYAYHDPQIRGFSHTHLHGTGLADLGALLLMPINGHLGRLVNETFYRSKYLHDQEQAEPGYYRVWLKNGDINAELAATDLVGFHRYRWPKNSAPYVIINPSHSIDGDWIEDARISIDAKQGEIFGSLHLKGPLTGLDGGITTYFVIKFSKPITDQGTFKNSIISQGADADMGKDVGAYVGFTNLDHDGLVIAVALSYQSIEQARHNLKTQAADLDFDAVRSQVQAHWKRIFDRFEVKGGTGKQRRIFYTALYHSYLMPTDWTEANGKYVGLDKKIHSAQGRRYYTDFSLWDTFRTLHPLLFLLEKRRSEDMMQSLSLMAKQGGSMPMWPIGSGYSECMVGTPADIVLAEAYLKGIDDFDVQDAYAACRAQATGPVNKASRKGIEQYLELGYICEDSYRQGTSLTTEYAYADFALANWAEALGYQDDARMFFERSQNWKNHWDPKRRFLRARKCDGKFRKLFYPKYRFSRDYVEGNAWQWTWYAPHDVPGLIDKFGSQEAFVKKLSLFFERGAKAIKTFLPDYYYWHGNEPDILTAYYFNYASRPDLTQKWVRWIMTNRYDDTPAGLDGNDDAGTLSAWYIFSALGFMPLAGTDRYLIGSPLFEQVVVHLESGDLIIRAENNSAENIYIQSVSMNGKPLTTPYINHGQLAGGGVLEFVMGPEPSVWGRDQ